MMLEVSRVVNAAARSSSHPGTKRASENETKKADIRDSLRRVNM